MSSRWLLPDEVEPTKVELEGLAMTLPLGWEARIRRREPERSGDRTYPVLHASTVPLDAQRADYGGGVVERLKGQDAFIALIEFGPDAAGTALFPEVEEMPRIESGMFRRNNLQRMIPGQAGLQKFFTYRGRAFCLYVVLGSMNNAAVLSARVNGMLLGMRVDEP